MAPSDRTARRYCMVSVRWYSNIPKNRQICSRKFHFWVIIKIVPVIIAKFIVCRWRITKMKVIVAGLPKTGTKSMVAALQELDMNVYDFMEHYMYAREDWIKIFTKGGTTEDFSRMYQGVDAVADSPVWYFWEELLGAFPNSKVILTMRENEDVWFESLQAQEKEFNNPLLKVLTFCSPSAARFYKYGMMMHMATFGLQNKSYFSQDALNELICKMVYRRHNSYVLQKAPKDKFLVYNVKEGWEPLCKFLGVDVPSKPFPHKNVKGNIVREIMTTNPVVKRMKYEMMLSISCFAVLFSYALYYIINL